MLDFIWATLIKKENSDNFDSLIEMCKGIYESKDFKRYCRSRCDRNEHQDRKVGNLCDKNEILLPNLLPKWFYLRGRINQTRVLTCQDVSD